MATCPNSFLTWGIISKRFCYTIFIKKYYKRKQQFLEDSIFFKLFFLPSRKFGLTYHVDSFPWLSWIFDRRTQTSQIHCCINYKNWVKFELHLDMFLSEYISQQFSFSDIVCFHPLERFARHLQAFHIQQFLLTWLVKLFFILKYFQQL